MSLPQISAPCTIGTGNSRIDVDELTAVVHASLFGCAVPAEAR